MATFLSFTSTTPNFSTSPNLRRNDCRRVHHEIRCCAKNSSTEDSSPESVPENVVLRIAWYASEFLGIAASLIRPPPERISSGGAALSVDESGKLDRAAVVESIKQDFERSYFVTGNVCVSAYEEDCEFADPAGSFRGLKRFKRNCSNFGNLLERSEMKLMKWEEYEDKGVGHWRFSCIMAFPWKPILSATGYTEYYWDQNSGRVCSMHAGMWSTGMFPKWLFLSRC
ncbi:uncharacterized protein LOC127252475 isoform X2 [Andrographis paniculata]|uniref:uncharacterized protein LOC127252475 isoform X2 n=1 Tax=Andrographis paniculata TaxID=175694 RepID=UPI0021E7A2ED|nr:uncharacterized protein LOC127252475 isoform X2 [Andrographis paniculata]